jgi:acyl dehydratase
MAPETREIFDRDERYVGRDMGGREVEITAEMVARFIAGTGDRNPWYRGGSPLGGALAPALILHSEVYRDLGWYLPNIYGNLHARQEWELFAPMTVGERLRTRSLITDRYPKRDREYVVNEVLVFNPSGRLISRSRTHQSFLLPKEGKTEGFVVDRSRERDASRTFKVGERDGEPIEAPARKITEEMCMAFSGPARNYHTNREAAIELGFPDIVVQGMLSVCLVAEMMTARFGLGFIFGGKMDLKLVNVLWGNDTTGARGLIVERRPEGKRTRAEVEVWCEKADGTKTVVGNASSLEM